MKSFIFSLTCLFVLFACTQQPEPEIKEVSTTAQVNEKVIESEFSEASFSISGMMCKMGCAKTIETNLSKMKGVLQASVDFETSLATVLYNSDFVQPDDLVQTVTKTGDSYLVSDMVSLSSPMQACCAKKGCTNAKCSKNKG